MDFQLMLTIAIGVFIGLIAKDIAWQLVGMAFYTLDNISKSIVSLIAHK